MCFYNYLLIKILFYVVTKTYPLDILSCHLFPYISCIVEDIAKYKYDLRQ